MLMTSPLSSQDFDWRDEYSVNVASIDRQHRHLLAMLKTMHHLNNPGLIHKLFLRQHLENLLDDMQAYAAEHFLHEEALMRAHLDNAHETATHFSIHHSYWQELKRLQQSSAAKDPALTDSLCKFLERWWLTHICETDRRLGVMLNEKGIY